MNKYYNHHNHYNHNNNYNHRDMQNKVNETMKPIDNMDDLENFMMKQPCYETHVVKINEIYEDQLMSILIPTIYEGFRYLYRKAMEYEFKYGETSKLNPDIEKKNRLKLFQDFLAKIIQNSTQQMKTETDRIKASSGSADIFDSLVKAVIKSKILLMTYNVDVMRRDLIDTKYHDTIIIHDFVHSCYIEASQKFRNKPELFWIHDDIIVNGKNSEKIEEIIKNAVEDAIRKALPLQDIILEFLENPYHQRENIRIYNMVRKCKHKFPHNSHDMNTYNANNSDPTHIINNNNHTIYDGNATYEMLDETINNDIKQNKDDTSTNNKVFGEFDISEDVYNELMSANSSMNSSMNGGNSTNDSNNSTISAVTNETDLRELIMGLSESPKSNIDSIDSNSSTYNGKNDPIDGIKMIDLDLNGENVKVQRYFENVMPKIQKSAEKHKQSVIEEINTNTGSTNIMSHNSNNNTSNNIDSINNTDNDDMFVNELLERDMINGKNEIKIDYQI